MQKADPLARALEEKALTGAPGAARGTVLAEGTGWRVFDIVCTSGPDDAPFEELHGDASVSLVLSGAFQYRTDLGDDLMTPGAFLLGSPGHCFTCGHTHGEGDRCISFQFAPDLFERIVADSGARSSAFAMGRLAPMRETAPFAARAASLMQDDAEELALSVAAAALRLTQNTRAPRRSPRDEARASDAARLLADDPSAPHSIASLARGAEMSPFRFLRAFKAAVGATPHQFLLRARLRDAAGLLLDTDNPVTDIAYSVGFEDISNFTRTFRAEFGQSPRTWRKTRGKNAARR